MGSNTDMEFVKTNVIQTIENVLGFSEPTLIANVMTCVSANGRYDRDKLVEKLECVFDKRKAGKLAAHISDTLKQLNLKRKRHSSPEADETTKKARVEENNPTPAIPAGLSALQIKEMMSNAQKMIEERKKQLGALPPVPTIPIAPPPAITPQSSLSSQVMDSKVRIAQLQAQIQARIASRAALLKSQQDSNADNGIPNRPTPLLLDDQGRTVDATGKEIKLTGYVPELKANLRAQKREQFKKTLDQDKQTEDTPGTSTFYDSRVFLKPAVRTRKTFKFHEKGKFEQLGQRLRTKAKLEKLQQEIAQVAQKTGISSATKLALIAPKRDLKTGEIPDIEWWDQYIIKNEHYANMTELTNDVFVGITHLVEHPIQMKAPTEATTTPALPIFLTKKERKKLRRQNRREAWKEKQEKIRLGLEPPPEPKVRMSNMMRVLGTQQVQDPTKIEAHVREQMAKRQKAHEEANAARKLTVEQRREKRVRKLKEDTSLGVHVTIYRIHNLSNPAKKFKVEANAKQLFMTGCVVLYKNINVVVVEGGPKQQKKFKHLMMHRIKWAEDVVAKEAGSTEGEKVPNECVVVWEGAVKQRNFGELKFKACPSESFAREHFKKHNVEHYWDLAYSTAVLDLS